MPKVISRSTISASNDAGQEATPLRVLYCICGDFALVCDRPLSQVPTRPLDGAHILRCLDSPPDARGRIKVKRVFKISARQGKQVMMKRPDGKTEKQYRFHCSRCDLPLGYEVTPPPLKSGTFTYILPGALTETQGKPPANVLLEQ
ncbi:hypothetical protein BCV69DRAFT_111923 [Microstroma glucosiphilum]|uniref:STEEP1 domain-containing protein n=1 Tax=Pseudomicrostroma glucosiphilum TaxID=1684307 RepID=A0A316UJ29_9BASI|nr:hypothetical protein BCV69DRAFT_111923 [Pseudomicrostroma glucosiphilum]PWN23205.1 hypothetical protein BCV69DRAFT_111923 [Pseudomicrostroma glucosiphilum]